MTTPVTAYCATCDSPLDAEMQPDTTGHMFTAVKPCVPCMKEAALQAFDWMDAIDEDLRRRKEATP